MDQFVSDQKRSLVFTFSFQKWHFQFPHSQPTSKHHIARPWTLLTPSVSVAASSNVGPRPILKRHNAFQWDPICCWCWRWCWCWRLMLSMSIPLQCIQVLKVCSKGKFQITIDIALISSLIPNGLQLLIITNYHSLHSIFFLALIFYIFVSYQNSSNIWYHLEGQLFKCSQNKKKIFLCTTCETRINIV